MFKTFREGYKIYKYFLLIEFTAVELSPHILSCDYLNYIEKEYITIVEKWVNFKKEHNIMATVLETLVW
jgi:hypothetical protein